MEITCVIPAFERLDLLARCLVSVCCQEDVQVEVIVTDDSRTGAVRDFTANLAAAFPFVRYLEGARSGNPVDNWNHGLRQAASALLLLVHQDEFLLDPRYLRRAVDAMATTGAAAVLGHTAVIDVTRSSRFSRVAPLASRLARPAWFLPMVNWVGPTAAFVFRAGRQFDRTLVQLVDVEFYGRVLATGKLVTLDGICVGSLGHPGQITATIDPVASALADLRALAARTPPAVGPLQHAASRLAVTLRAWTR
jgi:GT2 family glycosyltransferase